MHTIPLDKYDLGQRRCDPKTCRQCKKDIALLLEAYKKPCCEQMRIATQENSDSESYAPAISVSASYPLWLIGRIKEPIAYCPWCGKHLFVDAFVLHVEDTSAIGGDILMIPSTGETFDVLKIISDEYVLVRKCR